MNRTGHFLVAAGVAFFAALNACGDNDPAAMNGGTGGAPAGGAGGGVAAGGAGGGVADDGGTTDAVVDPGDLPPVTGDYLPFKVGNSWTYLVTELNHPNENKLHVITRMEAVGGTGPFKDTLALRVETQKSAGAGAAPTDATISWQGIEGNRIVRYRETSCQANSVTLVNGSVDKCAVNEEDWWMPARVVLDSQPTNMPYAANLKWTEMYTESVTSISFKTTPPMMTTVSGPKSDVWEIVNPSATITTPAGTFTACAIIKKTSAAMATKTYTYCRGVGKVKEEGATANSQTETLTAFTVVP
jgi:hypothetical protein